MAKQKRTAWNVLGRKIGTATGWDEVDTFILQLYDFEPANNVDLPKATLRINFENGKVETYDDEGKVLTSHDLLTSLNNVERS